MLQRGDEGQLDALPGQVIGLRTWPGIWLEPTDLGAGPVGGQIDGQLPPGPVVQRGEATVGGDLVQPGPDVTAFVQCADTAPGPHEAVLDRVLGVVQRPEHSITMCPQLIAMRRDEPFESRLVARPRPIDEFDGRGHRAIFTCRDEFAPAAGFHHR